MQTFRAYLLNPAGRIMSAVEVEAGDVAEAMAKMRAGGHPHDIEIWQGRERLLQSTGASATRRAPATE